MSTKPDLMDRLLNVWWGKVAVGVFILAGVAFMYHNFTRLESGQVERIWGSKFTIKMYEVAGKWPIVAVGGLVGCGVAGWGVYQLVTGKE